MYLSSQGMYLINRLQNVCYSIQNGIISILFYKTVCVCFRKSRIVVYLDFVVEYLKKKLL